MNAIPKPKKSDRPGIRKRLERKKKDGLLQAEVSTEGNCQVCGEWKQLYGDHKIKRRFLKTRWDKNNIGTVCSSCNLALESTPAATLLQKYPSSPYAPIWRDKIMRKMPPNRSTTDGEEF